MCYNKFINCKKDEIMENNIKFALALDNLNHKIAELNIKISKDFNNQLLKDELNLLLNDREILLKESDIEKIENLTNKYGSKKNG